MGKDNLLIGTARGKLGDVVFYRTGGEQRFRTRVRPTNPRTDAQLIQRCVVATTVKAYSDFVTICDHAFQNFEGKLKNHQRYMRLNIMKFRPIALAQVKRWSPIEWTQVPALKLWNWSKKDDVNTYVNPYIVAEGDLPEITVEWNSTGTASIATLPEGISYSQITYRTLIETLGVQAGDQITMLVQYADDATGAVTKTLYGRVILMPSSGNIEDTLFTGQGLTNPNAENYGNIIFGWNEESRSIEIKPTSAGDSRATIAAAAAIVSRYENDRWRRSNSSMSVKTAYRNLSSLEAAVASYLKSDTSSLYLNQATTGERQELELESIDILSDETDMYGMTIAEDEEKSSRRKK